MEMRRDWAGRAARARLLGVCKILQSYAQWSLGLGQEAARQLSSGWKMHASFLIVWPRLDCMAKSGVTVTLRTVAPS